MATVPSLLRGCDVAELAGETVFYRGANPVAVGTTSGLHDGGRYPDALPGLRCVAVKAREGVGVTIGAM